MNSMIYKAQELINGKSNFLTKEGMEQKKKEYYMIVVKKLPDIIGKILDAKNNKTMKYDHDHFSIFYKGKYKLKILISISAGSGMVSAITVYHIQYKDKRAKPVLELKGNRLTELEVKKDIEKLLKSEIKKIEKLERKKNKSKSDVFFKDFENSITNKENPHYIYYMKGRKIHRDLQHRSEYIMEIAKRARDERGKPKQGRFKTNPYYWYK